MGPVSAFPHSLGSRRRWAATALLASWCLSVCFVSDTSGPSLMVRPRASLRYVPRGALTCSTRREPSGKVRLACGRIRVSRQGEGGPGLSVLVVSQNAEDSDRTERASRSVPRIAPPGVARDSAFLLRAGRTQSEAPGPDSSSS